MLKTLSSYSYLQLLSSTSVNCSLYSFHVFKLPSRTNFVSIIYSILIWSILKYTEIFRIASHISVKNKIEFKICLQFFCLQQQHFLKILFSSYLGYFFPTLIHFCLYFNVGFFLQSHWFFFSVVSKVRTILKSTFREAWLSLILFTLFPSPSFPSYSHSPLVVSSLSFLFIFEPVSRYMDIFLFSFLLHKK